MGFVFFAGQQAFGVLSNSCCLTVLYMRRTRWALCIAALPMLLRMLLERERSNSLSMDILVTVCSCTRTKLWFGLGCSGHRMLLKHERNFGCHGCSSDHMLLERQQNYGSGMDVLVTVCPWTTNEMMVRSWNGMNALVAACSCNRSESMVGHGCSGHRMRLEHERNYGLGMDVLVTICCWLARNCPPPQAPTALANVDFNARRNTHRAPTSIYWAAVRELKLFFLIRKPFCVPYTHIYIYITLRYINPKPYIPL